MDLSKLQALFGEARKLTGHSEFVVVGSLSALGVVPSGKVPPRMLLSIDVDCYTRNDPGRIFDLQRELGEGSAFEAAHGYYLDPISPNLPTLPRGWEFRLVRVPLEDGVTVFFLDPNDAAVSKYARCEPRDREWLQAGLAAGLLSAPIIESRLRDTEFLDGGEQRRALDAFAEDRIRHGKFDAPPTRPQA
ncbi:MAG: hypothetical protein A3I00_08885 [Betaproteobacteria bacterium RIFCSPLOWO2_02_FULL_64_12]|nr:MAG: hypothetical protein A3I00_08885 [Betaproteobacteria bacterium RIFCSPLOWO2_02_FULL_64_12]